MLIKVTGSKWVNGSGWSYTEDLDSMEIDSMENIKSAAQDYAAEFAGNYGKLLSEKEDYQLRFYDEAQQNPLAKIWLSEAIKVHWSDVELVDGEGYTLTRPQANEALREFKAKGGIYQVFVRYNGRDIDDPEQLDWTEFPEEIAE
jgi:hypothetical protein